MQPSIVPNSLPVFDLPFPTRDNIEVLNKRSHSQSTSSRSSGLTFALRSGSVHAMIALTTISAFSFAAATGQTTAARRTPGAATVAAIHHLFAVGKASWYGLQFQGRKTATGEKFDMNEFTCAHRSLPLGSWIRVTNLRNHKSVVVRVNDRGPVSGDRIVDLSYAAAHAVGMNGIGKVKLETAYGPGLDTTRPLIAQLKMPASLVTFPLPVE